MTVERLHAGPCDVVLAVAEVAVLPGDLEGAVSATWDVERARRPDLFNGVLLSALGVTAGTLSVQLTDYRRFLAQRRDPRLGERLNINPVAVSGLVVTSDDRWLFGRRGAGVTQYPLHLEAVPSGTLDEKAMRGRPPTAGLVLDPVACLVAELYEEAGVAEALVVSTQPLGLFLDVEERTYDLAYLVRLGISAAELAGTWAHGSPSLEYSKIRALSQQEVAAAMRESNVVPTTALLWQAVFGGTEDRDGQ